jgi:hypothetical protein
MGSGGSTSLLPPGKPVDVQDYLSTIEFEKLIKALLGILHLPNHIEQHQNKLFGCYMVKPHGQLVLVSFTHYCASTPSLSTL